MVSGSSLVGVRRLFLIPNSASLVRARRLLSSTTESGDGNRPQYASAAHHISPAAERTLQHLQETYDTRRPQFRRQRINSDQAFKLSYTLGLAGNRWEAESEDQPQESKMTLPAGWHLLYFLPRAGPEELRSDGAFDEFCPGEGFPRRMWAGGTIEWIEPGRRDLLLGDLVTESTIIEDLEVKKRRNGEEMIVLKLWKSFGTSSMGLAIDERRNWVYLPPASESEIKFLDMPPEVQVPPEEEGTVDTVEYRHDIPTLFRFSALTFNGHQIHYNPEWARKVEGHPAPVVHGPLNVILMLNQWQRWNFPMDWAFGRNQLHLPASMEYRNIRPLFAGERYWSFISQVKHEGEMASCKVRMKKGNGDVAIEAAITWHQPDKGDPNYFMD